MSVVVDADLAKSDQHRAQRARLGEATGEPDVVLTHGLAVPEPSSYRCAL
ncbi:hypothetical protein [Streptomyces scopuliridis]